MPMPTIHPRIIVNLSPHDLTREMKERGVFDLPTVDRNKLLDLLDTGNEALSKREIVDRAEKIARLGDKTGADRACIHAPIELVSTLERELRKRRITPMYPEGQARRYKADTPLDGISETKIGYSLDGFSEPPSPDHAER